MKQSKATAALHSLVATQTAYTAVRRMAGSTGVWLAPAEAENIHCGSVRKKEAGPQNLCMLHLYICHLKEPAL